MYFFFPTEKKIVATCLFFICGICGSCAKNSRYSATASFPMADASCFNVSFNQETKETKQIIFLKQDSGGPLARTLQDVLFQASVQKVPNENVSLNSRKSRWFFIKARLNYPKIKHIPTHLFCVGTQNFALSRNILRSDCHNT